MDWYLVHTRRGCEQVTARRLEYSLHLQVYTAEVIQYRHGARCRAPLFPGYLFVAAPGGQVAVEPIDQTPGCGRLVCACCDHISTQPAALPGDVIELLRQRLAAIDAAGGLPVHIGEQGERTDEDVQWRRTHFALDGALRAPMTSAERIELLLHAAGADGRETEGTDIEPPAPAVKRPRRTRGHGRRIHY
ncbi:MAG: transcription termination/antitermination NusG family protein [Caldilineaceae bacterium]